VGKLSDLPIDVPRCKFGVIVDGFDADDLDAFTRAVERGTYYPVLSRWLASAEIHVSTDVIARHLRGGCRCGGGPFYRARA
jgi:hypothetical protein